MLKFDLVGSELKGNWLLENSTLVNRNCWIEIYDHEFLKSFVKFTQNGVIILVRESKLIKGSTTIIPSVLEENEFEKELHLSFTSELDWIILTIESDQIVLQSGPNGIVPIYLYAKKTSLKGSWDPYDLFQYLDNQPLNLARSVHYLCNFNQPYSRKTVFSKLIRVTKGSKVVWNKTNSVFQTHYFYPEAQELPQSRELKKDSDPVSALIRIISEYYSHRFSEEFKSIHTHLSGGFDSGLVTSIASDSGFSKINSYSLIQLAEEGFHQRRRCREFESKFDLVNHEIEIINLPIFTKGFSRMDLNRVIPWEDCYSEAFEKILRLIALNQGSVLLMGTGGDELTFPHWKELDIEERRSQKEVVFPRKESLPTFLTKEAIELFYDSFDKIDRAPNAIVSSSALDDHAITAPQCLRHGVWPIHPLSSQDVVIYCRSLPVEWRKKRKIFKEVLNRLGCSETITHPIKKESFSSIMIESLINQSREVVLELFNESRLSELNLLNKGKLIDQFESFTSKPDVAQLPHFYAVANLELTLRSLSKQM